MSTTKQASKHTPGPWTIEGEGIVSHPTTGAAIGTTRIGTGGYGEIELIDGTNEPDANARLIAAAPELLEAIQSCAAWLERYMDKDEAHFEPQKTALAKARAAIAKATGNA